MTETRFAMVSAWMENGNINEFIGEHPDVDRFELVSLYQNLISSFQYKLRML